MQTIVDKWNVMLYTIGYDYIAIRVQYTICTA